MRADVLVGSAVLHGAAVALFVHWMPPKEAPPGPAIAVPVGVTVVPAAENEDAIRVSPNAIAPRGTR